MKPHDSAYNGIDYVRSVLITLVILIHIVNFGDTYPGIKDGINFFFMSPFLLLTGYLTNTGKRTRQFLLYLLRIFLPYAIMVTAFGTLSLWLPVRDGLQSASAGALLHAIFVKPLGPYWFLHTMMICAAACYTAHRAVGKRGATAEICLSAALLVLLSCRTGLIGASNAIFYLAGYAIRLTGKELLRVFPASWWPLLPFAAVATLMDFEAYGFLSDALLSFSFICFVQKAVMSMGERARRCVGYVGRNTMPIYLFHPIFTMAGKYILPLFKFDPTGLTHAAVTILSGILGSLAIAKAMDATGASRLFGKRHILR